MALKEKCKIWFGQMSQGIFEILKYAHTGIKEWQNIEERNKVKQLELKLQQIWEFGSKKNKNMKMFYIVMK